MSYQLKTTETIPENVRRIASEEIKSAISRLRRDDPKNKDPKKKEADIHEARKSIKRLRALLRLVRPELGGWFRRENNALRDIGRTLSDLRDASIVLETFDALSDRPSELKKLQEVRSGLQEQKQAKAQNVNAGKTLQDAAGSLAEVAERVSQWPIASDGFEAIAEGLKSEYQGGRKAMSNALKKNDSLRFHEWRKRAKCQLFHMRLLRNFFSDSLREQEQRLHDLETALGDDHNLLILRQHLAAHPSAFGGKKMLRRSLALVSKRERKLRMQAQVLGEKIYAAKTTDFVEELRAEWEKANTLKISAKPARSLRKQRTTAA